MPPTSPPTRCASSRRPPPHQRPSPTPSARSPLVVRPPGPPQDVTALAGNGRAVVAWLAPSKDGGAPISRFTVTARPGTASCASVVRGPGEASCVVPGLSNGTTYTVRRPRGEPRGARLGLGTLEPRPSPRRLVDPRRGGGARPAIRRADRLPGDDHTGGDGRVGPVRRGRQGAARVREREGGARSRVVRRPAHDDLPPRDPGDVLRRRRAVRHPAGARGARRSGIERVPGGGGASLGGAEAPPSRCTPGTCPGSRPAPSCSPRARSDSASRSSPPVAARAPRTRTSPSACTGSSRGTSGIATSARRSHARR